MVQEVSSQSVKAQSSDLAILSAAARQLFESTVTMSTDSVVSILAALATVSQKSVPQAVQQPGHPRQALLPAIACHTPTAQSALCCPQEARKRPLQKAAPADSSDMATVTSVVGTWGAQHIPCAPVAHSDSPITAPSDRC